MSVHAVLPTPTASVSLTVRNPTDDRKRIVVTDYGLKYNILRILERHGCEVIAAPPGASAEEILGLKPDGVLLSPGPGDPVHLDYGVDTARALIGKTPIMGICLGHQVLARALGGKTYKLKFGHRGANHPVKELHTGHVHITAQNHGYAVDADGLPADLEITHLSLNDGTVRGFGIARPPADQSSTTPRRRPGPATTNTSSTPSCAWCGTGAHSQQRTPRAMKSVHIEMEGQVRMTEKPQKVMVIGSGPIVIGQAAEFDYAGAQACKALREEGVTTVLVNSNPATIMTDEGIADIVHIEPLTPEVLERIIARERPDGILPTLGGQTGLNLAVQLADRGILEKYNVRLLGTPLEAIRRAEDRELFRQLLLDIGEPAPPAPRSPPSRRPTRSSRSSGCPW